MTGGGEHVKQPIPRGLDTSQDQSRRLPSVAVARSRKARAATRRKRRMDNVAHDLSDAQWQALQAAWGGCASGVHAGTGRAPVSRRGVVD